MCFDEMMKRWKKKSTKWDLALLKLSSFVFGIWVATLFPQLTSYEHWYILAVAILLWLKPGMVVLRK